MSVYQSQSDLSRGDLRLFLTNAQGYKVDPFSVKWTVFSEDGRRVSGNRLPAVRKGTGDYYAPWHACVKSGCHTIVWDYQLQPGCGVQQFSESFFVLSSTQFSCCASSACSSSPNADCMTFMSGSVLGRGDLALYLKDSDGIPINAYSVTWQIFNSSGCPVSAEINAIQVTLGEYYADWFVNVGGGDYYIRWKVLETQDTPAEAFDYRFSVISSCASICTSNTLCSYTCDNPCPPPLFPTDGPPMAVNCCDFEIPRVVHLSEQLLPVGGAFTNQVVYNIPSRIRRISFYIRYRRNLPGGRGSLKLLWGNGVEEVTSTLINNDFTNTPDTSVQNMYLSVYNGPTPLDDSFIFFQVETIVPGGS
jgi:hypothetical protein